jgi:hypothetical protein
VNGARRAAPVVGRGPPRLLALVAALGLLAGCTPSVPLGPIEKPEIYPDRTSPEASWSTYLWAWRTGDVEVLKGVLGLWLRHDLDKELERNGAPAVSEWYRKDADDLLVDSASWTSYGEALAYLRVVLKSHAVPRAELDFSFLRRPDGWVVSGRRLLR